MAYLSKKFFLARKMKNPIWCLFLGVLAASPLEAFANEKVEICVKYQIKGGWSKGYPVESTIIRGSDLNRAVRNFSRFKRLSTYAVVFWAEDQVSIFELPATAFGRVPRFKTIVEDQEKRKWQIKRGHVLCF